MAAAGKSSHARTPEIDVCTVFKLTTSSLETGFGCGIQTPDLIADVQPETVLRFRPCRRLGLGSLLTPRGDV